MNEVVTHATPARARWFVVVKQAMLFAVIAVVLAFGSNAIRADGLPLVAKKDFEIVVPCPEPVGSATAISADDPRVRDPNTLVFDARAREQYQSWHLPSAIHAPFDWLAEQDAIVEQSQQIARDIARSRKHALVVYGDGGDPDPGQHWAVALNSAGLRNVFYVRGGAPALRDGAPARHDGAPALRDGAPALRDGAPALRDGAPARHDGAPALRSESSAAPAATEQP